MTELLLTLSNGETKLFTCLDSMIEIVSEDLLQHTFEDGTTVVSVEVTEL